MGIRIKDANIIDNDGGLVNSPSLTVSHPSASETVVTVGAVSITPLQGAVAGFASGGSTPSQISQIDKFPFSISGGTSTDVGDLSQVIRSAAGHSSNTDGFRSGGADPAEATYSSTIDKFPFSISGGTATDIGDLTLAKQDAGGHSNESNAFSSGGYGPAVPGVTETIEKFPFSQTSGTATDVGDLSIANQAFGSHSSFLHGFTSGGGSPLVSNIDKFPFSISGGTATDVGDITQNRAGSAGHSSTVDGFSVGGTTGAQRTTIDKFPFSISSGTATYIGDLSAARTAASAQTSVTEAFTSGGYYSASSPAFVNIIDKFPFSISVATATDVGDLSSGRTSPAGHQD